MTIVLRDYQTAAIDSARAYLRQEPLGRPLIAVPTGGGKSLMASQMMAGVLSKGRRAIYLTMTEELVSQTLEDFHKLAPEHASKVTIACAGLGKVDLSGDVVLGTAQSIHRRLDEMGERDLVIVDEAHCIPRDQSTMLGKILAKTEKALRVGLTATPYRLDSGRLDEGLKAPFTKLVYQVHTRELQKLNYLCELKYSRGKISISTEGIHIRAGEFVASELEQAALNVQLCHDIAVDFAYEFRRESRKCGIMFCVTIEHAKMMAEALRGQGINAKSLSSETSKGLRKQTIAEMKAGEFEVLCNVNITSIGFNVPRVDIIASVRPTMSTGLWVQQVGRGLRPFTGKPYCRVRDYAGNLFRHGPVEDIERGVVAAGEYMARECASCGEGISRSAKNCPHCGAVQPVQARSLQRSPRAYKLDLNNGAWIPVVGGTFRVWTREHGSPSALVCSFTCGNGKTYRMWIDFDDRDTWAANKNRSRWFALGGKAPFPTDAQDADWRSNFGMELQVPRSVMIRKNPKNGFVGIEDVDL